MKRLRLSGQAKEMVKRLMDSKDTEKAGYIAAVDPQTGEVFYGKNVVEAAKEGRSVKHDPKAVFFFVRVGYPSVHVLKSIHLQGYIEQEYFPKIKGYVHDRNLHLASSAPDDMPPLDFIADTGFSGSVVLDPKVIYHSSKDFS